MLLLFVCQCGGEDEVSCTDTVSLVRSFARASVRLCEVGLFRRRRVG